MTLVLKNSRTGKSCKMEATEKHIEFLNSFGVKMQISDETVASVEDPGFVMSQLKKIGS